MPGEPAGRRLLALIDKASIVLAQGMAEISYLQAVADTASNAIITSEQDRADLHADCDALTARITALESLIPTLATTSALNALIARETAIEARSVTIHRATVQMVALTIGASADLAVTWPTPFPDAKYTIDPPMVPALAKNAVTATVKSQTAAGCVVTIQAAVVISAGTVLDITAYRYS